ncbi:beta-1,3-galactosyltransferase 5-like, partial [Plodia interpunctella]|uniref:beta-1,3-galactosyltransferase 5-like n=1 Tax=Plodia interpunctella TaxID=58824 RepID=UPI002367DE98
PQADISLLGPYDTMSLEKTSEVYDQLVDLKNFTFLFNPPTCQGYDAGLLLLLIVSSKPTNFANRMVIRHTWGVSLDSMKLVFLLGETVNSTTSQEITRESRLYDDIVQGNFVDAYRNMTYKHVMGLKWVTHHCPMVKYIVKTDDDTVVNIYEVWKFLRDVLSPFGTKGLIACHLYKETRVERTGNSKWKVTLQEYKDYYFPSYCAGWALIYSQDVVPQLLQVAQSLPYFWIDDVHITGICARTIGASHLTLGDLMLTRDKTDRLIQLGPQQFGPFLFGPPDLTISNMLKIWYSLTNEYYLTPRKPNDI